MLFRVHRTPSTVFTLTVHLLRRTLSISHVAGAAQLPPRMIINEKDIEEAYLKGSGPGGQKINKTSSAVQLKHVPTGIVVKSQATRSQSQNRKIARQTLAEKIEELEKGPESRTALKAEIKRKQKASKSKKARRKYRALQEEREVEIDEEEGSDMENQVEQEAKEERV